MTEVPARDFAIRFRDQLAGRRVWLFSTGPVGDPSRKIVQSMEQDPADVTRIQRDIEVRGHQMFAGKLDPQALSHAQRASLLVFRGMDGDFRDWAVITQWAGGIAADLAAASTTSWPAAVRRSSPEAGARPLP